MVLFMHIALYIIFMIYNFCSMNILSICIIDIKLDKHSDMI